MQPVGRSDLFSGALCEPRSSAPAPQNQDAKFTNMRNVLILFLVAAVLNVYPQTKRPFSIEGHRGARGWAPENTIPSFKKAIDLGADTIELDVVITKDLQVLVSHEPWFSSLISLDPNGDPIPAERQKNFNIYKMTYADTQSSMWAASAIEGFPISKR